MTPPVTYFPLAPVVVLAVGLVIIYLLYRRYRKVHVDPDEFVVPLSRHR